MGKIGDYNKEVIFDVAFDNRGWKKLEDFYNEPGYNPNEIHTIEGLFINEKGKFGKRPYVACDKIYLVDFPQHLTEVVEQMIADPEVVQQINEGKAGFTVRAYMSNTYNRECYAPRFVNIS